MGRDTNSEQAAWAMGRRGFLAVQRCDSGWDYTFYGRDLRGLDGGQLDNPELSLQQAADEIAEGFGWGQLTRTPLDYESFAEEAVSGRLTARNREAYEMLAK